MPTLLRTLLRTLLPSLVTRHPLRMPPTDFRRSSARMSAASPQSRVAVRVNQGRDGVSPVVASIYCSPHPAALQIDPPPGSGDFALMIPRPENCFAMIDGDRNLINEQFRLE
jgi:hypothetical protein